jgi:hypothetical protein
MKNSSYKIDEYVCVHTELLLWSANGLLIISKKQEAKYSFCVVTMSFLLSVKLTANNNCIFFS